MIDFSGTAVRVYRTRDGDPRRRLTVFVDHDSFQHWMQAISQQPQLLRDTAWAEFFYCSTLFGAVVLPVLIDHDFLKVMVE